MKDVVAKIQLHFSSIIFRQFFVSLWEQFLTNEWDTTGQYKLPETLKTS